jgi:D-3-phosphoglycerate dehydrogenase
MPRYRVVKLTAGDTVPDISLEQERLARLDAEVVGAAVRTPEEIARALQGADAAISLGPRFSADVFERLDPRFWLLVHAGTGYDTVDVDAATARGVMVANLPFQCVHEVANSALAYVLALNRRIVEADRHVRAGGWDRSTFGRIGPIEGETFGILGFGNIARATARKAAAFDMVVVAYDPYVDPKLAQELGVELLALDELLARADYVANLLPHNASTHHLMGEAQFCRMKPTAYFVNTARGKTVDEAALVKALQEGWIAGAGLDVFEVEPLPADSPLRGMENVLLAPHLAGTSIASAVKNRDHAIQQVEEALRDGKPSALVNKSVERRLVRA